jgi:hypothetical protein
MVEGWDGDDYLILFDEAESAQLTEGYGCFGEIRTVLRIHVRSTERRGVSTAIHLPNEDYMLTARSR